MKKILLAFLLLPFFAFSQTNDIQANAFEQGGEESYVRINYKTENKGTPYLYDNWREGYIVISDSIISHQDALQLNLTNGDLIIGAGKNKETGVVITDKTVTGFAILKDAESTQKLFFAKIKSSKFEDSNRSTKFYEVISNLENSNYLIKEESKYLFDPNKSRGYQTQNSIPQEYKTRKAYYIKDKSGKYVKTKLNKKSILKKLGHKKAELTAYINSKKINFSKEQDVSRVLNYYHSL
jgi:hypothetical protein